MNHADGFVHRVEQIDRGAVRLHGGEQQTALIRDNSIGGLDGVAAPESVHPGIGMGDGAHNVRMPLEGGDDVPLGQAKVAEHLAVAAVPILRVAEPAAVPLRGEDGFHKPRRVKRFYIIIVHFVSLRAELYAHNITLNGQKIYISGLEIGFRQCYTLLLHQG